MIDQDLKKKIVNTISFYEGKCDKMQLQINALKNAINQLILKPSSNHQEDERASKFCQQLDDELDPIVIEKKAEQLATHFAKLHKKSAENTRNMTELLKQNADALGRLAKKAYDVRAVSKLQKMIETGVENQAVLIHFNQTLSQCVSTAVKELAELHAFRELSNQEETEIDPKVNDSLLQLLDHLSIPQDLDSKREPIVVVLNKQLSDDGLSKVIDDLTGLVVDAFNVEQNRFKGFLHQVTHQLQDFDVFLKSNNSNRKIELDESLQLEDGIQHNIDQIKNHLDNSTSIDELSSKISENLDGIGTRIKDYRENAKKREKEYEEQVEALQLRLSESEQSAEEIKGILSFQKYRINHDRLTGIPNRECYDEQIIEAFQRARKHHRDLSLAVCDIDRFKLINDTLGHLAGDKVLKKVASILKTTIRSSDFVARVGGEEFVIIFEKTSEKMAATLLEKLRKKIEECQFVYRDKKVGVSVSFGLTSMNEKDDIESLFMRADNAMYNAKNAGRNRIEIL